MTRPPPRPTLFPYTTLFRSALKAAARAIEDAVEAIGAANAADCDQARGDGLSDATVDRLRLDGGRLRSEEHTSELQSHVNLVCRLLLEKKNIMTSEVLTPSH